MDEIMKLIKSLTRLADVTADLVNAKLMEAGKAAHPVQHLLPSGEIRTQAETPAEADKPKRTRRTKEQIAAETMASAVGDDKGGGAKTAADQDMKATRDAKVEFFLKTLKMKGIDGVAEARKVIAKQGVARLNDIPVEKIPAFLADLDAARAQLVGEAPAEVGL